MGIAVDRVQEYFSVTETALVEAIGQANPSAKKKVDAILGGQYWFPCYGLDEANLERLVTLLRASSKKT